MRSTNSYMSNVSSSSNFQGRWDGEIIQYYFSLIYHSCDGVEAIEFYEVNKLSWTWSRETSFTNMVSPMTSSLILGSNSTIS